jgi:hypothetical protein
LSPEEANNQSRMKTTLGATAMTRGTAKRLVYVVSGALALAPTGFGALATTGHSAVEVYAPRAGFTRMLGPKTVLGYFKNAGGRCAVTLTIAEAPRDGTSDWPSAVRLRVSLAPAESFDVADSGPGALTVTCGPGGRTLSVGLTPLTAI